MGMGMGMVPVLKAKTYFKDTFFVSVDGCGD
jgi:hypothetical protein